MKYGNHLTITENKEKKDNERLNPKSQINCSKTTKKRQKKKHKKKTTKSL